MVWTIRPIGKNEVSEDLKIQFSFPRGAESCSTIGRGYDESVPEEVTKTASSGDRTT